MEKKYISITHHFPVISRELDAWNGIALVCGDAVKGISPRNRLDHWSSRSGLTARPGLVVEPKDGWEILPAIREDRLLWKDLRNYNPNGMEEDDKFVLFHKMGHGASGILSQAVVTTASLLREAVEGWVAWRDGRRDWVPERGDVGYYARRMSLVLAGPGSRFLMSEVLVKARTVGQHGNDWVASDGDTRRWIGTGEDDRPPHVWTEVELRRASAEEAEEVAAPTPSQSDDEFVEVDES